MVCAMLACPGLGTAGPWRWMTVEQGRGSLPQSAREGLLPAPYRDRYSLSELNLPLVIG